MPAAGIPEPRAAPARGVAQMALEMASELRQVQGFADNLLALRIGIHSGPVVAGVIGRRKFAYDLWGDTVNLASRLESHGEPGRILVSEETAKRLEDRFWLSPVTHLELKGRGQTAARFLLGELRGTPTAAETP